jgi:AAA ATPase domain
MDAVRFGRWISERRLKCGWRSQRALVEAMRQHPLLSEYSISEDFLARLEAGQLVHPFRGSVRRRVLALAWLLCKAPRDVRTYLQAAELSELKADEAEWMNHLRERLATRSTSALLSLPPRPTRLFGRTSTLEDLVNALCTVGSDLYAITGMPGVGKSALAYEALHQLASNERERLRLFPDGIVTFAAAGRQGSGGLISLLNEITAVLAKSGVKAVHAMTAPAPVHPGSPEALDGELAGAIDRVRLALADKRLLLLLDDLDARFPLRQGLRALLSHSKSGGSSYNSGEIGTPRCVVLTTSRYIPAPSLATYHLHLGPLDPDAALELFIALVSRSLDLEERSYAEQICAAIGYLPLAIEAAAASVETAGIPLSLLAARVAEHPLDTLLDGERELHSTLTQALDVFEPEMQRRFALLATLGTSSFGIESAAAIRAATTNGRGLTFYDAPAIGRLYASDYAVAISGSKARDERGGVDMPVAQLADAASDLGQFVRHSLVEPKLHNSPGILHTYSLNGNGTRYSMHPLLHAYAVERLSHLEPEIVHTARGDALAYALAYVEHYKSSMAWLCVL